MCKFLEPEFGIKYNFSFISPLSVEDQWSEQLNCSPEAGMNWNEPILAALQVEHNYFTFM